MGEIEMISDFETERMRVRNWQGVLSSGQAPPWLEKGLARLLTPNVLRHLPPSLQLSGEDNAIADWVSLQAGAGETFLVQDRHSGGLLGLLILSVVGDDPADIQLHIGYLLAEDTWGRGLATELVSGVVDHVPRGRGVTLMAGVGLDNPGSAKVLEKAGFDKDARLSTKDAEIFVLKLN